MEVQPFRDQPERELHPFQDLAFDLDGLLAPIAEPPDKPLGDNTIYRRGGEVGLHAHVGKAAQGPRSVIGVQRGEDEVARQGRLDADLGRVLIAYLAYHHYVGVGAQDVPQAGCKSQANRGVDLHLVQAGYLVLDRVLDGYDVLLRGVQLFECGVERRGLARTCRPRNQGGPVRPAEHGLETLVVPLLEAQLPQIRLDADRIEQPQHDLLTEGRGQGGDPEVYLLATEFYREAPILGQPLLRDVHLGQQLEPGRYAVLELGRDRHDLPQDAVYPETDRHLARLGLNVDVRGAVTDRVLKYGADKTDYRLLVGASGDPKVQFDVVFRAGFCRLLQYFGYSLPCGEELGLHVSDLILRGHDRGYLVAGDNSQVLEGVEVARVAHRNHEVPGTGYPERDGPMFAQYPLGYESYYVPIEVPLSEFDKVEPEPLGLGLGKVCPGDEP